MTESLKASPAKDTIYKAYSLLDVTPGDSAEKIKESYRNLAGMYHPDKFSSHPEAQSRATTKMIAINEAYALIKNAPQSRDDRLSINKDDTLSKSEPGRYSKNPFSILFRKYFHTQGNEKTAGIFFSCFLNGCGLGVFIGIIFSIAILVPLNIIYNYLTTGTANLTVVPINIIVIVISALFFGLYNGIAKTIFAFLDNP